MKSEIVEFVLNTAYHTYEKRLATEISAGPIPHHIAVIMDGNRRFAREIGLEASAGHKKGKEKLEELLEWCLEFGIKVLTVYAFSTENLKRKKEEIEFLMDLFEHSFLALVDDERIHKHRIKVTMIGQKALLPKRVQDAIGAAENATASYGDYCYNVAVAYGGRQEIIDAIRVIAQEVKDGAVEVGQIDEEYFSKHLYTADFPDPDLVLRTSGEERVSNFLLWQSAYAELYFTDVYWPGFRKLDFLRGPLLSTEKASLRQVIGRPDSSRTLPLISELGI